MIGLMIIAIIYLALAVTLSQVMHFSLALDEGYHLEYVTFIKQHGRLPINYEERTQITRADFPPLYQLLVALLSAKVNIDGPPYFKLFWDSFRYRAMDHHADKVWLIKTEDYQRPYLGRFLVWQIGRWLSIILSLATVMVVFLTLRETPLGRIPLAALAGAAFLAFIPRYIILGSSLNDDNLLGLLAALYFWMLVKAVNNPKRWWPFMGMGIFLGLSMTVKYTLIVIPLEVGLVCVLMAKNRGLGWAWAWKRIGVIGVIALLCSSWWFGWNFWFLNTVAEEGWLAGLVRPLLGGGHDTTLKRLGGLASGGQVGLTALPEDTNVGTFLQWMRSIFLSFWGVRLDDSIPLLPYAYLVIGLMLIIAAFGLWRLWQTEPSARKWLLLFVFHIGIFFILPLIRFNLTRRLSVAAQGRHILIPAATAIVALLVWGLIAAIPQRWQRPAFTVLIIGFMGWTGVHLSQYRTLPTTPLPLRTLPQAAEWLPHPVNATFGDSVELVSYELDPQPARGLLGVNLAWRSLAHTNESYLLKLTLIDRAGKVVSHWLGYNGQGRLPTLSWDPGDSIFDRLALPLPDLPAGEYRVQVQLLSNAGPLPIKKGEDGNTLLDAILPLADFSLDIPTHLSLQRRIWLPESSTEVAFDLWLAGGPAEVQNPKSEIENPKYRYPATISVITSRHDLTLALLDPTDQVWPATHSEANIHTFVIGPRWPSGRYRLRMTLEQNGEVVGQATTEPLLTVENWWERRFEPPEDIAVPVEANFANQLKFLGYTLPQNQVKAGEAFPITLYWQALPDRSPQADFTQFNHLLDSTGALRGGYDRRPLEYYSTLLWAPGEVIVDGYAVPVDADAPPGEYFLDVGYYLTVGESAVHLPLIVDGKMIEKTSITVGPIEILE